MLKSHFEQIEDLTEAIKKRLPVEVIVDIGPVSSVSDLEKNFLIDTRSSYNQNYKENGIELNKFGYVKVALQRISILADGDDEIYIDIEKQKLNNMLAKMNDTFHSHPINSRFVPNDSFGGYTETRKDITIYTPKQEPFSEYAKIVQGINYHEIGHTLYTPSFKELAKEIKKRFPYFDSNFSALPTKKKKQAVNEVLSVVNTLEDGRMENLMAQNYPLMRNYLNNAFCQFLLRKLEHRVINKQNILASDVALVCGRKYTEMETRKWIISQYRKYIDTLDIEDKENRVKRVLQYINKFITMSWRDSRAEMLDLALGFYMEFVDTEYDKESQQQGMSRERLMKDIIDQLQSEMNNMGSDEDGEVQDDIKEQEKKALEEIKKKMKQQGAEEMLGCGGEDEEDKATAEHKALQHVHAKNKEEIDAELKGIKKKMNKLGVDKKVYRNNSKETVTSEMKKERSKLERKLKELARNTRSGYKRKTKVGCLDISEARRQQRKGGTKIFKQYKSNQRKALDVDIAFVLDCSYSMCCGLTTSKIKEASKELWIASKSCSTMNAGFKVFCFSSDYLGTLEQCKGNNQFVIPMAINSTVIKDAMIHAEAYLDVSSATYKWLICLTDGDIFDSDVHRTLVQKLQKKNVVCGKLNLISALDRINEKANDFYDYQVTVNSEAKKSGIVELVENVFNMSAKKIE